MRIVWGMAKSKCIYWKEDNCRTCPFPECYYNDPDLEVDPDSKNTPFPETLEDIEIF